MSDETLETRELTPEAVISGDLIDRLAGFLVAIQKADPTSYLVNLPKVREVAATLQGELQKIRGPWVVCHLCKPPLKVHMDELKEHDVKIHNAWRY